MLPKDFFEIATKQYNKNLPFVIYRKPKTEIIKGLFQNNDEVYYSENLTETGFIFTPFNTIEKGVLIPQKHAINHEVVLPQKNAPETPYLNIASATEQDRNNHIDLVEKALKEIKNNTLKKVVLSRKETIAFNTKNPIVIFKRLLANYFAAFVYCWYHPKIGLWLGATPETLLHVTGNNYITMALAGTKKEETQKEAIWQEKEIQEQKLVTNYITENLKPIVNTIKVEEPKTVKAGALLHLKTKIFGTLNPNNKDLINIVQQMHPTPAICGLPREKAKQFIIENENYNREFYTGFLGEINCKTQIKRNTNKKNIENNAYAAIKNTSDLYVNLRCMKLEKNKAILYIGGGITKDSVSEKEWEETVNKAHTIKKVLF